MKSLRMLRWSVWLFGFIALALKPPARADNVDGRDKIAAPYFEVHGGDGATDGLPLKSTNVVATIAGVIANVSVTQVYRNEGKLPLEAVYVFPASTSAAVHGLTMTIGDRQIVAQIKEKVQARADYTKAKEEGKSASLLEQHRPNVFQMNVANILPGDEIKVVLKYTEMLVPTDRVYDFVFPTVVGPRYTKGGKGPDASTENWTQNPYLKEGQEPLSDFDIKVLIEGGMPVQDVASTSHEVLVNFKSRNSAQVNLAQSSRTNGNRDFILKYRLAGNGVQTGLLLYEGEKENFFVALLEPSYRVVPEEIPGRDYVFVVDVSGSMNGFPLTVTKELLKNLVGHLRSSDTFNILTFAGASDLMSQQPLAATSENITRAVSFMDRQNGGGGTNLLPALERTFAMPLPEGRSRSIVIVTDGYIDVETQAFDLVRKNLNKGNVFVFGIGSSVNRHLIEGIAHVGLGEPFVVTNPGEAAAASAQFQSYVSAPLLTQASIHFDGFEAYDVEPPSIPDVMANRPVAVFGKWRGMREGTIRLTGSVGKGRYEKRFDIADLDSGENNEAIKYLWARRRIRTLGDYNRLNATDGRKSEITAIGLNYNLLTDYTSFVAVDQIVRHVESGPVQTVNQPLPLPQGVSQLAVGGEIPTTPEPETWALMILALVSIGWTMGKRRLVREAR